jgi:hypothetical protein
MHSSHLGPSRELGHLPPAFAAGTHPAQKRVSHLLTRRRAMRRIFGSILLVSVLAIVSWAFGANAAHADVGNGPNAQALTANCGSAGPVDVVINFQAAPFAAAHVVGGAAFTPISFGEETITFTPAGGSPQTRTEPAIAKGQSSNAPGDTVNCSFDFTATDRKSGATIHIVGTVTGVIHGQQA